MKRRDKIEFIKEVEENGPNHVYYNIIINHDPNFGNAPSPAIYNSTQTQKILDKSDDWHVAVIRFTIPGQEIPIFICPIQEGILQADRNLTPFSVTLRFSGTDFFQNLIYVPDNNQTPPPPPSQNNGKQSITPYYYIFTYQHFIDITNKALSDAFSALKTAFPLAPQTEAPYFIYNSTTQLISLVVETSYAGITPIEIYINANLLTFYEAIEVFFLGYNQVNGKDFRFVIKDNINNTYFKQLPNVAPPATPAYFIFTQEYNTITYWNGFRNIVFIATVLPIQSEYVPQKNNQGSQTGATSTLAILTDFEPLLEFGGETRSIFQFYVQGQYRWVDLLSSQPLKQFSLSIFWQDIDQNLYPLTIPINESATIKLLFERKKLEN